MEILNGSKIEHLPELKWVSAAALSQTLGRAVSPGVFRYPGSEKKMTLKKRSINGRQEMTSRNSYNCCLSEGLTAHVAGYGTYLLYFSMKRGRLLHDSELVLRHV